MYIFVQSRVTPLHMISKHYLSSSVKYFTIACIKGNGANYPGFFYTILHGTVWFHIAYFADI